MAAYHNCARPTSSKTRVGFVAYRGIFGDWLCEGDVDSATYEP